MNEQDVYMDRKINRYAKELFMIQLQNLGSFLKSLYVCRYGLHLEITLMRLHGLYIPQRCCPLLRITV